MELPLLTLLPASVYQQILWLLGKAGKSSKDYVAYTIENPGEVCEDTWDWIKRNKLTCFLLVGGALVIVVPVAIGFGTAGPVAGMLLPRLNFFSHDAKSEIGSIAAGWQAMIGNVAAGSLFATLQSLTMTGVLTSIGGWMIGTGVLSFFTGLDWGSAAGMSMRVRLEDDRNAFRDTITHLSELDDESETSSDDAGPSSSFSRREDASQSHGNSDASRYNSGKGKLNDTLTSSSSTYDEKNYQLEQDLQRANEQITALRLTETGPSHPEEDAQIVGSPPYRPRGYRRARPSIPGPRCPDNGYSSVAAEYKGRLCENPDLRKRLKREGRCVLCRQPGAPHTFPSRN